ncbi:putative nuclease HARBI1 [Photinus pyralis]|uniref:putative nuclease HARBI1 n=1 Tax=Photinus pyralis TaxID=7054 RepID=UPI0012670475|nr:putative nuclease HARBI1 [Photinus pyralis]
MELEDVILWDQIINNIQDAEQEQQLERETFIRKNPFLLSDQKFVKLFRLTKPLMRDVIETLTPHLQQPTRRSALSVETKVLATVRFLATGSYQELTGSSEYVGISQASMSRCISEVCEALNAPEVFNAWVHFPRNLADFESLRRRFYDKYHFPGVIGCIDCTHIAIIAPFVEDAEHAERAYINRKNYHSLNVQLKVGQALNM